MVGGLADRDLAFDYSWHVWPRSARGPRVRQSALPSCGRISGIWLGNGGPRGSGIHVAFSASSRSQVDAFYKEALKAGGKCLLDALPASAIRDEQSSNLLTASSEISRMITGSINSSTYTVFATRTPS